MLGEAGHTSPQAQPLSLERRGPRAKHLLVWKLLGTHLGPTGDTNELHTSPAKVPSGQALPHHLTAPFGTTIPSGSGVSFVLRASQESAEEKQGFHVVNRLSSALC